MSFWSRIERRIEEIAGDILPDEFSEKLAEARSTLQSGDLAEAKYRLLALTQERPDHAGAQVLLGTAFLKLDLPEDAIAAFEQALQHGRTIPEALLGQGWAAHSLGRKADATNAFMAAQKAASGDRELLAEAYTGLGTVYRQAGEFDKAVREFRKAVAEAGDDDAIAALGEALCADEGRSHSEAKRVLQRLTNSDPCPGVAWLALGRIALRELDGESALRSFQKISQSDGKEALAEALQGQGWAQLIMEKGDAAESLLRESLTISGRDARTFDLLGSSLALQSKPEEALDCYQQSLDVHFKIEVATRALDLALRSGNVKRGVLFANQVLPLSGDHPNALTARGLDLLAQNNTEAALATFTLALNHGGSQETLLAMANLHLKQGNTETASHWARLALQKDPTNQRARLLVSECGAATLGVHLRPDSQWYDLAIATQSLCAKHPDLTTLLHDASSALSEYDHPLLVAVMGEFSSGKSSFVNAFVGAEIAPTGITPTTATINILKYGRERGGRVVYRDHTSREISGANLAKSLSEIDDHEARRVRHVEILMPIDVLERVNIVDTPGLNSILPEHEAVARSFLQRADAVVWLFTANQAGKSTEKRALDTIAEQGVRVLGVLNKVDQLSDSQVLEILEFVDIKLKDRIETCVPISARRAMLGEPDSGWEKLSEQLESRFFAKARFLKKQALGRRLASIHNKAIAIASEREKTQGAHTKVLRAAATSANEAMLRFVDEVVKKERALINRDAGLLYQQAAREVLELVQPRTLPFGSHKTSAADRDYLLGLLDSGYESLLQTSKVRCFAALRSSSNEVLAPLAADLATDLLTSNAVEDSLRFVESEVYATTLSFLRGFLRGGFVDQFFHSELPTLELTEEAIYHALFRAAPEVGSEFALPLAQAGAQLLSRLGDRLEQQANQADVQAFEIDAGLRQALLALEGHRRLLIELLERGEGTSARATPSPDEATGDEY